MYVKKTKQLNDRALISQVKILISLFLKEYMLTLCSLRWSSFISYWNMLFPSACKLLLNTHMLFRDSSADLFLFFFCFCISDNWKNAFCSASEWGNIKNTSASWDEFGNASFNELISNHISFTSRVFILITSASPNKSQKLLH